MITLKQWFELVDYRITETNEYLKNCYGRDAQTFDSWNGIHGDGGYSLSITFDRKTQIVYEVEAYDYRNNRSYKVVNPAYLEAEKTEHNSISFIDDINYTYLDVDADFLEKANAIVNGEIYDTRVQLEVEFREDELFRYMKMAHELDISFNQLVENAIKYIIENPERLKK
jgi:hypothetical protein